MDSSSPAFGGRNFGGSSPNHWSVFWFPADAPNQLLKVYAIELYFGAGRFALVFCPIQENPSHREYPCQTLSYRTLLNPDKSPSR